MYAHLMSYSIFYATYSSGGIGVVDFGVAPTKEWTKRGNLGGGGGGGIILTVSRYLSKCMISRSVSLDQLLIRLLSIRWYIFNVCF